MKKNKQDYYINIPEKEKALEHLLYPAEEDIYNMEKKEGEWKADSNNETDEPSGKINEWHDEEYNTDSKRSALDVPGTEAVDESNAIDEDEENSYYSIGGDDHNKLEEDKGS